MCVTKKGVRGTEVLGNGAMGYKLHVENTGLSKTGILLLWKGNRFVHVFVFARYLPSGFSSHWLPGGEADLLRSRLVWWDVAT